jgi:hypothetical protein
LQRLDRVLERLREIQPPAGAFEQTAAALLVSAVDQVPADCGFGIGLDRPDGKQSAPDA